MRVFLVALALLAALVGAITVYAFSMQEFAHDILAQLNALPDSLEKATEQGEEAAVAMEKIIACWEERTLFVRLGIPYDRSEQIQEKLLQMQEFLAAQSYPEYLAARRVAVEDMENIRTFEEVSLLNLI